MNTNYLQLTATAQYKGQEVEFTFDPYNDCTDMDGLKGVGIVSLKELDDFEEEVIDSDDVTVTITDFGEVPDKYTNYVEKNDLWEFAEAFAECDQKIDVVEAALECGVSASDIDEAYSGHYGDDEEFAQDMAEQIGAVNKDDTWPNNCIDWERAASDLMMDYSEHNGYYFRSM